MTDFCLDGWNPLCWPLYVLAAPGSGCNVKEGEPAKNYEDTYDVLTAATDAYYEETDTAPAKTDSIDTDSLDTAGRCTYLGESGCLSYATALFCYDFPKMVGGHHYKTVDCPEDQHCEKGKCITNPGKTDPNCGPGWKAKCHVTDEFDFVEEKDHSFKKNGAWNTPSDLYLCGEDDAVVLRGIYRCFDDQFCSPEPYYDIWISLTMSVDAPPAGSYYRMDIKHDKFYQGPTPECDHELFRSQKLTIQFGDEQRKEIDGASLGEECVYQGVATFTTAGIEEDEVYVQFQNTAASCKFTYLNFIALAKTRIWSCQCVEQ